MQILSSGNIVYQCNNVQAILRDYIESLSNEEFHTFTQAYLGAEDTLSADARTVHCPIFLPNSHYLMRAGGGGNGVFPCDFGSNRVEVQVTLADNSELTADASATPTISGQSTWAIREVKMNDAALNQYKNHRGSYAVVSRRFVEVFSGWRHAAANQPIEVPFQKLLGSCCELQIIAVAGATGATNQDYEATILPKHVSLTVDSIKVRDLDSKAKILMENYQSGFIGNREVAPICRVCFASHARSTYAFSGAFNMQNVSNIIMNTEFSADCNYKVIAVILQSNQITAAGTVESYVD